MKNKACKSLENQLSCLFEGLGLLPNCRSRFSDSNKKISAPETSWAPHRWQNNEKLINNKKEKEKQEKHVTP